MKPDRRAAMLEALADHMLANGLAASSLRGLAGAAGTSDRMLLYYFRDKAELVEAALELVAARLTAILDAAAGPPRKLETVLVAIAALMGDPRLWPYQRLFLEIASRAAAGDAFYRTVGERLGRGFLAWGAAQLDAPDEAARARDAARLLVLTEGMVFLRALGLDDVNNLAIDQPAGSGDEAHQRS